MDSRKLVVVGLLLFVGASVAAWAVREFRQEPADSGASQTAIPPAPASKPDAREDASAAADKVIAYYFHGNVRCTTCNTMEAYAQEAVESGFPKELAEGALQWRVVNYQEPGNEHFRKDFDLVAASLVLVSINDGKQAGWKLLADTWILTDDKAAFVEYVQTELQAFLASTGGQGKETG